MTQKIQGLATFSCGDQGQVISLSPGLPYYRQRLLSMGLYPGVCFKVVRVAPFGCPIEIVVRGCALSLRKQEISILQVKRSTP